MSKKIISLTVIFNLLRLSAMAVSFSWSGGYQDGFIDPETGSQLASGSLVQLINASDNSVVTTCETRFLFGNAMFHEVIHSFSMFERDERYFMRVYNAATPRESTWYGDSTQISGIGNCSSADVSEGILLFTIACESLSIIDWDPEHGNAWLLNNSCPEGGCPDNTIHYVDIQSSTPESPYLTWDTAATTIQDAVNVARDGDTVLVTDGVYATGGTSYPGRVLTNRVCITNSIIVKSVNGASNTSIVGEGPNGNSAFRCVLLDISKEIELSGFTISNGHTRTEGSFFDQWGGGICANYAATEYRPIVEDCIIISNSAHEFGGGVWFASLKNCKITGNSAERGGGASQSILYNCIISKNSSIDDGGGVEDSTLNNCTLSENTSQDEGGGADGSTLNNCILRGNVAKIGGGAFSGNLNNCLLYENSAISGGGGTSSGIINNSVIVNNTSPYGGGARGGTLNNCIIYYNTLPNWDSFSSYNTIKLINCNTTPENGLGCVTNDPQFVDAENRDFRLEPTSPCVDAGKNQEWMLNATDFEGKPRILNKFVDIGAYEFGFVTRLKALLEGTLR